MALGINRRLSLRDQILILSRVTPGDPAFYSRWEEIGELWAPSDLHEIPNSEITILVIDHSIPIDEFFLDRYPKLKWIVSPNTGHTHIQADLNKRKVSLISLKGETEFLKTIRSVSEFVIRQMLNLARSDSTFGTLLNGKTLGIVGLGRIGKQVSVLAHSFGMHVKSVDKNSNTWQWRSLFQKSDFISIHLPEEPGTHERVNRELILLMKPTAYLINTSRGSVLDQNALLDALKEKKLAGAALDVWTGGIDASPLNIRFSFHVAGGAIEDRIRTDEFCLQKLKEAIGRT